MENNGKIFYRVQKGDSLLSVSERFEIPPVSIIKDNGLKKEIEEGDLLFLERKSKNTYKILPADTVDGVCLKFGIGKEDFLSVNGVGYVFYGLVVYV